MVAMFRDRTEAGKALAARLSEGVEPQDTIVFALPRGGVPVAAEIARVLKAPLDLLLVRKIGAPGHEEYAIGAIVDGEDPEIVVNLNAAAEFGLSKTAVEEMGRQKLPEIERRRNAYLHGRSPLPVAGKRAIVVDDGIATGASIKAALQALARRKPKEIVLAVPVAPPDALADLRDHADEIICLQTPRPFFAVGAHYADFRQVEDSDVLAILDSLSNT